MRDLPTMAAAERAGREHARRLEAEQNSGAGATVESWSPPTYARFSREEKVQRMEWMRAKAASIRERIERGLIHPSRERDAAAWERGADQLEGML